MEEEQGERKSMTLYNSLRAKTEMSSDTEIHRGSVQMFKDGVKIALASEEKMQNRKKESIAKDNC